MQDHPSVSVVVVSDYAPDKAQSWQRLRTTLASLAAQAGADNTEFLLVESRELQHVVPADIKNSFAGLRLLFVPATSAYELKNAGACEARGDIVVLLDADCVPVPGWLAAIVSFFHDHPDAAVVSGPTSYPGRNFLDRVAGLIGRGYMYQHGSPHTLFVADNNVAFRRNVLLEHLLTMDECAYGGNTLQAAELIGHGHCPRFEPAMGVEHAYYGWSMEKDIRNSTGYAVIATRRADRRVPFAGLLRLGYLSIPVLFLGRVGYIAWTCLKHFRRYRIAWYELPAVLALIVPVYAMEMPGMLRALRHRPLLLSDYR